MGIWDRLGFVLKSYISPDDERVFRKSNSRPGRDPDLNEAYEELEGFLKGNGGKQDSRFASGEKEAVPKRPVTEEIRKAFEELGLTPEAAAEECKDAYKKLLKIHHPDHHTNHQENMRKATEKTSRVNAAYDRIEIWFKG